MDAEYQQVSHCTSEAGVGVGKQLPEAKMKVKMGAEQKWRRQLSGM